LFSIETMSAVYNLMEKNPINCYDFKNRIQESKLKFISNLPVRVSKSTKLVFFIKKQERFQIEFNPR